MSNDSADLDQRFSSLTERFIKHISQEVQQYAAYFDTHFNEHVSQQFHGYMQHLDTHLSEHLTLEVARQMPLFASQVSEHLSQQIHQHMAHIDAHLSDHLSREIAIKLGTDDSRPTKVNPKTIQDRILILGRLLTPYSAQGHSKIRLGNAADGGYVLLDDFDRVHSALSLGVGQEMEWDLELATRDIKVYQFDHTIAAPPHLHENITFYPRRIAAHKDTASESLASALDCTRSLRSCIVKMDIEGDEWDVINACDSSAFNTITQLVCELHNFERVDEEEWFHRAAQVLTKLQDSFAVVHVHANNFGLMRSRGNIAFPDIIEVTFANRANYDFIDSLEVFPTAFDAPNRTDVPDIFLGSFKF